jgi:hypothetical protein
LWPSTFGDLWFTVVVDSTLEFMRRMNVGIVTEVSDVHSASFFKKLVPEDEARMYL